jgi:hypothetical protein
MDALIDTTSETSWLQSSGHQPGHRAGVAVLDCVNTALIDYYRCAADAANFDLGGQLSEDEGYFRFGGTTCYGRSASGYRAKEADALLYDVLEDVATYGSTTILPFHPTDVINNLRFERYASQYKLSSLSRWKQALRNARARAACILTHAERRIVNGQFANQHPSRFPTSLNGAFLPRRNGLAVAEVQAILQQIAIF